MQRGDLVPWSCLKSHSAKCNVDATLFDDDRFGVAMCIHDAASSFIKAKTVCLIGSLPPSEAEALGLLFAVNWLQELDVQRVTIELDC